MAWVQLSRASLKLSRDYQQLPIWMKNWLLIEIEHTFSLSLECSMAFLKHLMASAYSLFFSWRSPISKQAWGQKLSAFRDSSQKIFESFLYFLDFSQQVPRRTKASGFLLSNVIAYLILSIAELHLSAFFSTLASFRRVATLFLSCSCSLLSSIKIGFSQLFVRGLGSLFQLVQFLWFLCISSGWCFFSFDSLLSLACLLFESLRLSLTLKVYLPSPSTPLSSRFWSLSMKVENTLFDSSLSSLWSSLWRFLW